MRKLRKLLEKSIMSVSSMSSSLGTQKTVGEAGAVEVHDLIEEIISEDVSQLTGRRVTMSICARAKGML